MKKPRIYWQFYPKSRRGYWRVSKMPYRSVKLLDAWSFAHSMAREMNAAVEANGTGRP